MIGCPYVSVVDGDWLSTPLEAGGEVLDDVTSSTLVDPLGNEPDDVKPVELKPNIVHD